MIQANELRIGNVVKVDSIYKKIDALNFFSADFIVTDVKGDVAVRGVQYEYLEPLELTNGILSRIGFEQKDKNTFFLSDGFIELYCHGRFYSWNFSGQHLVSDLEYLHQLQNIYYCLVGEELKINL